MLVGNMCTAGDILNLFLVNHALPFDQDYSLYIGGGNILLPEDKKIMNVLKEMTSHESIVIQMRPILVTIFTSIYPNLLMPFYFDITRSLSSYIPYISRKFGFPEDTFLKITLDGNPNELGFLFYIADYYIDIEYSISQLKIASPMKLEVHYDQAKTIIPKKVIKASIGSVCGIEELLDMLTEPAKDQNTDCMIFTITNLF